MKENQKNGRRMDGRKTGEKIVECAGQLIAEKGFASVTSKEICRAAGVNLAAVNYHFGSRDGLYLAVLENVQQYLVEHAPVKDNFSCSSIRFSFPIVVLV